MNEDWLQISDDGINVNEIMQQIRERIARENNNTPDAEVEDPVAVADDLWREMIGTTDELFPNQPFPIRQQDCDIIPRHYVIDWRIPILGPAHAIVRRLINAEIRRYLLPTLEKQSRFNRKVRRTLQSLAQENRQLRQELEELRRTED